MKNLKIVLSIKILIDIIKKRHDLGLQLDDTINDEFQNNSRYKNLIFSNGVDLVYEFFNMERKTKSNILSKSIQLIVKNSSVNQLFKKIADKGILF